MIKRAYDNMGRIRREDYYDTEGKPMALAEGYSTRVPVYEGATDHVLGYRYYDPEGREVQEEINEPNAA